jgi:hypothetical protein
MAVLVQSLIGGLYDSFTGVTGIGSNGFLPYDSQEVMAICAVL